MATVKKTTARKTGIKTAAAKAKGSVNKAAIKAKATVKKVVAKAVAKVAPKPTAKAASKSASKAAPASTSILQVGNAAPDFKLQDDSGREVSLGEFRGKKVVLYFYPKDNTPGCTTESCDFRDNVGRLGRRGAVVLGLSADSVESHRKFKAKQGLNFPLLSDPDRQALEAYGVWQEKSLYGRKFMGIVRTTVIIDEKGNIAKVFPKVSVTGHVDEVIASL